MTLPSTPYETADEANERRRETLAARVAAAMAANQAPSRGLSEIDGAIPPQTGPTSRGDGPETDADNPALNRWLRSGTARFGEAREGMPKDWQVEGDLALAAIGRGEPPPGTTALQERVAERRAIGAGQPTQREREAAMVPPAPPSVVTSPPASAQPPQTGPVPQSTAQAQAAPPDDVGGSQQALTDDAAFAGESASGLDAPNQTPNERPRQADFGPEVDEARGLAAAQQAAQSTMTRQSLIGLVLGLLGGGPEAVEAAQSRANRPLEDYEAGLAQRTKAREMAQRSAQERSELEQRTRAESERGEDRDLNRRLGEDRLAESRRQSEERERIARERFGADNAPSDPESQVSRAMQAAILDVAPEVIRRNPGMADAFSEETLRSLSEDQLAAEPYQTALREAARRRGGGRARGGAGGPAAIVPGSVEDMWLRITKERMREDTRWRDMEENDPEGFNAIAGTLTQGYLTGGQGARSVATGTLSQAGIAGRAEATRRERLADDLGKLESARQAARRAQGAIGGLSDRVMRQWLVTRGVIPEAFHMSSDEQVAVRHLNELRDEILHAKSGAAVTDSEMRRLLQSAGFERWTSPAVMRSWVNDFNETMESRRSIYITGAGSAADAFQEESSAPAARRAQRPRASAPSPIEVLPDDSRPGFERIRQGGRLGWRRVRPQ